VDKRSAIRIDVDASQAAPAGPRTKCGLCGVRDRAETGRQHLSSSLAGVVTCHQLECGHAWHRIVANVGRIFPGLVRNATFVPCDCQHEMRESR
jgi:hypothetical protein